MTVRPSRRLAVGAALLAAFWLSGLAGLAYQIVWSRILGQTFGATAPAIATVLAVFMGGMGLGSFVAGRRADQWSPARAMVGYAVVEVGVALFGLAAPTLLDASADVYAAAAAALGFGPVARGGARACVALLALGPPTLLMGASFPMLARVALALWRQPARTIGALQAANVAGAVVGALMTGFVVLPMLGNAASTRWAAVANVVAALAALATCPALASSTLPTAPGPGPLTRPPLAFLVTAASTGFVVLGFEVVWTRTLGPLLGGSVFALSSVLACVLVGLALGAAIASLIGDRVQDAPRAFGVLAIATAFAAAIGFRSLSSLVVPSVELTGGSPSFALRWWLVPTLLATPLVLPATLLSGIALPIGIRAAAEGRGIASATGWMIGANTVGAIAGSLFAGLFGLAALGSSGTAAVLASIGGALPSIALWPTAARHGRLALGAAATAVVIVALTMPRLDVRLFAGGLHMLPESLRQRIVREGPIARTTAGTLLYAAEGSDTVVFVERTWEGRSIYVGGKPVASDRPLDLRNQYLLGHLPALLHGAPRSALVVGLGAGTTAGALAMHAELVVCELSPEVIPAARMFGDLNHDVVDRDGVTIVLEDARTFLRARPDRYDVISVDPVHPYVAGAASLYTRDYFRLVRSRLAAGGVAAHWLPLYQLGWEEVAGVLRAWLEVFPRSATVYLAGVDAVLVGAGGDEPMPFPRAAQLASGFAMEHVRGDLERVYLETPERLAATASLGPDELRALVGAARPLTDDQNWLEFSAPRYSASSTPGPLGRLLAARRDAAPDATPAERTAHETYGTVLRAIHATWSAVPEVEVRAMIDAAIARDPSSAELRARAPL